VTERVLRIFVSSPSDVAGERARVKLVADRLNGELEGIVRLDILRWEDGFYTAAHSFQQAIDAAVGNMTATDMVLCIVWKRAGLKLNPSIWQRTDGSAYESGTVLEFETAVEVSRRQDGTPDVYLFRKTADVLYRADRANEEMEQYQLLQAVWKRWTESTEGYNTAGYQSFVDADDFEGKLEACLRQWLARRGVVATGPLWDRALKGSPFRGLAAFEAAHAPVFFGREAAIARATAKLRQAPFLLLIGGSGSGKSSLLRAGLIPRVTAPGVMPDIDLWRTAIIVPSGDPLAQLADALCADDTLGAELRAGDFSDAALLAELFAAGGKAALAPIRTALARAAQARKETLRYEAPRPARLLVAVDQVERLFVEVEPARVETFAGLLRALVEAELASVIAALRSDTYGRFQAVAPLLALLNERGATLDLLPPSPSELEDIVTRPVAACHPPLAYETDARGRSLAEALAADARGGDALPLLQMTLQRLFDAEAARGDAVLRFADYPGMDAAVARTAEEAVAGLSEAARATLPSLLTAFVRDVTVDEHGGLQSMVIVPVARTAFERGEPARAALIDEFVARRLLTTEEADGVVRVRPVHEALLRVVPAAVAIIKENAALIRVRHTLEPMVAEWRKAPAAAKGDFLATSPALIAGAAQLSERFGEELAADMRAFIADSAAADARRRDAERSRARRIIMATAAGLVIALTLAGLAGWQWQIASEQRARAQSALVEANTQRTRAETALTAATGTAETLVFDLAREFRNRPGMPVDLVNNILGRVQALQRELARSGSTADLRRLEAVSLYEQSDSFLDQGDRAAALDAAERALAILEALAKEFPDRRMLRRELAISLNQLGNVRRAGQQWPQALEAYGRALAIIQATVAAEPTSLLFQRDLWLSYNKIADVQTITGLYDEALATYGKGLAAIQELLIKNPDSPELLGDLAFNYNRVAIVLGAKNQRAEALDAYREALTIHQRLAAAEPDLTDRKRDVYLSFKRVGEALAALGRGEEAIESFQRAIAVMEQLAPTDRGNALWQGDLAAVYELLANQLVAIGKRDEALAASQKALASRERMVAITPSNQQWQSDLAANYLTVGDALSTAGRRDEAAALYRNSAAIFERLAAGDPGDVRIQTNLIVNLYKLAQLGDDATARLRQAVAILRRLDAEGKLSADRKGLIGALEQEIERLAK
jgi:tetratricopeptide (TPR) repeat protein